MMNAPDNCESSTNGSRYFDGEYSDIFNLPTDKYGNSILTGDGKHKEDCIRSFTLSAIETWQIIY